MEEMCREDAPRRGAFLSGAYPPPTKAGLRTVLLRELVYYGSVVFLS